METKSLIWEEKENQQIKREWYNSIRKIACEQAP